MAQWYVKDLSKITGVSVQTLHHYDRIDLLNPSLRRPNGYRLYSEQDLVRLQQIIALKFFGFELSPIKKLLSGNVDILEHFKIQAKLLEEKTKTLEAACSTLNCILSDIGLDKSIPWKSVIKSIEVYRMTQQLENKWVNNVFTADELKQYAEFELSLKERYSEEGKNDFEIAWQKIVEEIQSNIKLGKDPKSQLGMDFAKKVMDLINGLYGKEHANLKHAVWNRGFKKGQGGDDHGMSSEMVEWLDKAIDTYYRSRIYGILDQANKPTPALLKKWDELLEEMYGTSKELKQNLIEVAMKDDRVSPEARKWLKEIGKLVKTG